jgi:hypothetical protein
MWLAIDPVTMILPSLHLGERKNDDGMSLIHDLKQRLVDGCLRSPAMVYAQTEMPIGRHLNREGLPCQPSHTPRQITAR